VLIYSFVVTYGLLKVLDKLMGLRVSREDEQMGLDLSEHGEAGYTW
jgi:Amt family ammonium transporter